MEEIVRILSTEKVTHDVKSIRVTRPQGYSFLPGQATELSIPSPGMSDKRRPFTFTSLTTDPFLEFTIKRYPGGVTEAIHKLTLNDELLIHDVFGEITYKGPGIFIAGGAGITPFIGILRDLRSKALLAGNSLIFGNKTSHDIILREELKTMLGGRFINILSQEKNPEYYSGIIDPPFLKNHIYDFTTYFYVCGPPAMTDNIVASLILLGAAESRIVIEGM